MGTKVWARPVLRAYGTTPVSGAPPRVRLFFSEPVRLAAGAEVLLTTSRRALVFTGTIQFVAAAYLQVSHYQFLVVPVSAVFHI